LWEKRKSLVHARNDVNDPNRPYCESQHSRTPDRANLRNLNNRFDLHRHVEGERRHSDSATGMPTAVAEDLDEQVRATVDDLWVVGSAFSITGMTLLVLMMNAKTVVKVPAITTSGFDFIQLEIASSFSIMAVLHATTQSLTKARPAPQKRRER
jgi:hypothetical protein